MAQLQKSVDLIPESYIRIVIEENPALTFDAFLNFQVALYPKLDQQLIMELINIHGIN